MTLTADMLYNIEILRNSALVLRPSKLRTEELTLDLSMNAAGKVICPTMLPTFQENNWNNNSDGPQPANWGVEGKKVDDLPD